MNMVRIISHQTATGFSQIEVCLLSLFVTYRKEFSDKMRRQQNSFTYPGRSKGATTTEIGRLE